MNVHRSSSSFNLLSASTQETFIAYITLVLAALRAKRAVIVVRQTKTDLKLIITLQVTCSVYVSNTAVLNLHLELQKVPGMTDSWRLPVKQVGASMC